MPRVPTYDAPQVARQGLPDARQQAAPVGLAVDVANNQAAALNRANDQVADETFKIGLDMQKQANALRVDDALNQAREAVMDLSYGKDTGYTNLKGRDALERASGQPLADEYGGNLNQRFGAIEQTLGNDAQRLAFRQRANDMSTQFRASVMQHENQEFKNYALSTGEGIISTRQREIGLNYDNPAMVADAVTSIRAQAYNIARLTGKSAEWAEMQARGAASNAHLVAIDAALQNNNPRFADAYLKNNAKDMDANDILRANGLITKQLDVQIGNAAGRDVMTRALPALVPSDAGRLTNLVVQSGSPEASGLAEFVKQQESGGKRYGKDGQLLTSPKGAKGEMQVLDSTNTNPGFGVRPAADNSPDERARVGRDYLDAMLKRYQGNVPQALAAYNAGPGSVDAAIREANKNGTPAQWMTYLPKPGETIPYVQGIMKQYSAGGGAPAKPTEFELHQQVDALIDPTLRPEQNKAARQVVSQQLADLNKATKQREDEAVANVQSALIANGGRFTDLPLNLRSSLPPAQYDNMLAFADKVAKGQPIETDWQLYYSLKSDPQVLGAANLMAFRNRLGESEFKQLTNEQQDLRQGKTDAMTNLRTGKDYLNQYMREAGIDPTPKDDDAKGAAVVGRIWNAYEQRIRAQESNIGRKLKPEELKHEAAALFSAVEVNRPFWFDKQLPAAAVAPDQVITVPATDREQITQALRSAGKPVTDQAIQDVYRRARGVTPFKRNG
jgi:Transglycosylase SLT domain